MDQLILFDIDATLLKTDGAGIAAMGDAGRDLFGSAFATTGVEFAGRLDPLILRDLLALNRVEPAPDLERRFRDHYKGHLDRRLQASTTARALPGVHPLLDRLQSSRRSALGVLTGNFPETGRLKLLACGLDPATFSINAWGDDSPHDPPDRAHLPLVALRRFLETHGRSVRPDRVTIIGDTPHDIRCARANNCQSIGVATGMFDEQVLRAAGADAVLPDLSRTDDVVALLEPLGH